MSVIINREELAWAAGFVDGEGTFSCKMHDTASSRKGYPTFAIQQTGSLIALDRFAKVIEDAGVPVKRYGPYGPYKNNLGTRPHYRVEAYGFEKVQAIAALLWTWLSAIKREQIVSVLYTKESRPWGRDQASLNAVVAVF